MPGCWIEVVTGKHRGMIGTFIKRDGALRGKVRLECDSKYHRILLLSSLRRMLVGNEEIEEVIEEVGELEEGTCTIITDEELADLFHP